MPWSVYCEHFRPSPMTEAKSRVAPLAVSTFTYLEYDVCRELGITHSHFRSLSRQEKKTWIFYFVLRAEKEKYQYEKNQHEAEAKASAKASSLPDVRRLRS